MNSQLPTVNQIFKSGYSIFKEEPRKLINIGALSIISAFVFIFVCVVIGVLSFIILSFSKVASILFAVILIAATIVAFLWFISWIGVAFLYAIAHHTERPTIKDSFAATRSLVWQYIWVNVLVGIIIAIPLIVIAAIVLLSLLAHSKVLTILLGIIGVVIAIVIIIALSMWFAFANWILLLEHKFGTHALRASKELLRHRFWEIFGLIFLLGFIYGLVSFFVSFIFEIIFSGLGVQVGKDLAQLCSMVVSLFTTPILSSCLFTVYEAVRKSQRTT